MSQRKKFIIGVSVTAILSIFIGLSVTTFLIKKIEDIDDSKNVNSTPNINNQQDNSNVNNNTESIIDDKNENAEDIDEANEVKLNPFGNQKKKSQINELDIIQYIHWMSHQKVRAEDKWGFFEITNERIDWLLEAINVSREHIDMADQYEEILYRWRDGNFNNVAEDHNFVWEILGGEKECQRATGVLSDSEEQEYINNTEQIYELYEDETIDN